jgi:hypothetical protein
MSRARPGSLSLRQDHETVWIRARFSAHHLVRLAEPVAVDRLARSAATCKTSKPGVRTGATAGSTGPGALSKSRSTQLYTKGAGRCPNSARMCLFLDPIGSVATIEVGQRSKVARMRRHPF